MARKLKTARFDFSEGAEEIVVIFEADEVIVWRRGKDKRLRNLPARWGGRPYKPRVADCLRAIADTQIKKRALAKPLAVCRPDE